MMPDEVSLKIMTERPPVEAVLYRSERTLVARKRAGLHGGVIAKRFLGPDAATRMRHEARMLERLRGLPGVVRLISAGPEPELVLQDDAAVALAGQAPMAPDALLTLALHLARALAGIHRRGVLHLDITPANILLRDGAPVLIDFHLATLAAEERRGFTHHNEISGTLAYIAPELTGRIGQGIDHRADLYALGATLYEMAAGAPPFGRGDPLRLMRDLITTVPPPPPGLAPAFGDIILRLLEKEPDRRYQSAEGLEDDLEALHSRLQRGETGTFALGTTDFPLRLLAPSRLVARAPEVQALAEALEAAREGRCRAVLVHGPAGVGKTALIDQLRPIVTAQGGWFVAAKFPPRERAGAPDPMLQVTRDAAALMLAEPEAELMALRATLHARLGDDAGLLSRLIPELAALVGPAPPVAAGAEARTDRAVKELMAAIASPARPLVIVHDDLQWAPALAVQRIGTTLARPGLPGLLIVCAYRDGEADLSPGLRAALARWESLPLPPRDMALRNLAPPALGEMLGETLRLPEAAAGTLAEAIFSRTKGNPQETIELLNGLRREKTLVRGPAGWEWDPAEIRRHVGDAELSGILQARIAALPAATQGLLADLSCLGAEAPPSLLAAASGAAGDEFDALLSPALEDGLLVLEHGGRGRQAQLRFRHQRVREAIQDGLSAQSPSRRQARHLALARRLAARPGLELSAAEQYLAALPAIEDPAEMDRAAQLFGVAAEAATRLFRHDAAERYHAGAIALRQGTAAPDAEELTRLRTERMKALYHLGRHDEADAVFAALGPPGSEPLALAEATCVELLSLGNRGRHREATAIGLAMLDQLGIRRNSPDLEEEVMRGLAALPDWLRAEAEIPLAERPRTNDPLIRATARLINRLLPAAQLHDPLLGAWLALESQRLWARHGVCPELAANLARSAAAPNVFGGDYRAGYDMAQLAVATGEAFGFEPETSLARQNLATFALHWFERLEHCAPQVEAASAGLIAAGEIQAACINYIASLGALFDCAPTLEGFGAELTAARDFAARTGNAMLFESFHNHNELLRVLNAVAGAAEFLDQAPDAALSLKPLGLFSFHASHAIAAALFGAHEQLLFYTGEVMPILPRIGGAYRCAVVMMLRAVALAEQARREGAASLPAELSRLRAFFAARAADAPANFKHLAHFIEAEAAWTLGDNAAGLRGFDRALQYAQAQTRPWHHALIAERAGLFHLANGLEYSGRALLWDARNRYAAWGAKAVVHRLTAAHGFLDAAAPAASEAQSGSFSAEALDLLGVLRASQALSSATSISTLKARVVETLAAMTGATSVMLLIWDEIRECWCLAPEPGSPSQSVEEAAALGRLPLSPLRYVERTRETLVVDDARLDDRFSRDPYFAGMARCSLLVLPVFAQDSARAVLLLENRLTRGVFSQTRLNLVTLVAGQLAVSLNNAWLYASLESRVAERTEALAEANRRLEVLSILDGLTGLANRRRFDEMLAAEWQRAQRSGASIGLVMIDIDYFKRYNDRYGHVRGDHCLRVVAAALAGSTRAEVDIAARYGGEEFALILPGATPRLAAGIAARARAAVKALGEAHAASPFGVVTVSLGVAAMVPAAGVGCEALVERADSALYWAKQAGRNGIAAAPEHVAG